MMMPPAAPNMSPMMGGYAPMESYAPMVGPQMTEQMPMRPQMPMPTPQQDLPPQIRAHLINALENFASR
jgi:hypothetical protein